MAIIKTQVPFAQINLPFGGIGVGNIYYVANTSDTLAYADLFKKFGTQGYDDGSAILYPCTATSANVAIQAALDACVANRNDYVLVMPSASTYTLLAALTMSNKNVHLIAPGGLGRKCGANNSTRLQGAAASYIINISAASCEVAGFFLKNYSKLTSIYLSPSSTAVAPNIHHNTFPMTTDTTGNAPAILGSGDGGWFGTINDNFIFTYTGHGTTITSVIHIDASAGECDVSGNRILIGNTCTATIGIECLSLMGSVCDNYIGIVGDVAGSGAGVMSMALSCGLGVVMANNRIFNSTSYDITGAATEGTQGNTSGANGGSVTG
jgi:hypothetical protein